MTTVNSNTRFIEVATGNYPLSAAQIREQFKFTVSFQVDPPLEDFTNLGFAVVQDSVIPTADVVTEGAPVLTNGVWVRTWVTRNYTPDEISGALATAITTYCDQINAMRDLNLSQGLQYTFPDATVGSIQLRGVDRVNLVGLRIKADAFLAYNLPNTPMSFRSGENVSYTLTPQQMVDLTNAGAAHAELIYKNSWDLKDLAGLAHSIADIPALPADLHH